MSFHFIKNGVESGLIYGDVLFIGQNCSVVKMFFIVSDNCDVQNLMADFTRLYIYIYIFFFL